MDSNDKLIVAEDCEVSAECHKEPGGKYSKILDLPGTIDSRVNINDLHIVVNI